MAEIIHMPSAQRDIAAMARRVEGLLSHQEGVRLKLAALEKRMALLEKDKAASSRYYNVISGTVTAALLFFSALAFLAGFLAGMPR